MSTPRCLQKPSVCVCMFVRVCVPVLFLLALARTPASAHVPQAQLLRHAGSEHRRSKHHRGEARARDNSNTARHIARNALTRPQHVDLCVCSMSVCLVCAWSALCVLCEVPVSARVPGSVLPDTHMLRVMSRRWGDGSGTPECCWRSRCGCPLSCRHLLVSFRGALGHQSQLSGAIEQTQLSERANPDGHRRT